MVELITSGTVENGQAYNPIRFHVSLRLMLRETMAKQAWKRKLKRLIFVLPRSQTVREREASAPLAGIRLCVGAPIPPSSFPLFLVPWLPYHCGKERTEYPPRHSLGPPQLPFSSSGGPR
ncbi:hypothetical protein B296_00043031 [Ensete ventricosum]|uniref:Uncharacterized protein n=1 Tax=Ensete ventricosum TaxID=4639 RepID=A0A426XR53_ENSVE|nr:hypothetical protein B296_00043031 [Ensete ventricosum]